MHKSLAPCSVGQRPDEKLGVLVQRRKPDSAVYVECDEQVFHADCRGAATEPVAFRPAFFMGNTKADPDSSIAIASLELSTVQQHEVDGVGKTIEPVVDSLGLLRAIGQTTLRLPDRHRRHEIPEDVVL